MRAAYADIQCDLILNSGPPVAILAGMKYLLVCLILLVSLAGCGTEQDARIARVTQVAGQPGSLPTVSPVALPATPTFVPTVAAGQGGAALPTPVAGISTVGPQMQGGAIRLEDTAWSGGWRNRGASIYGGRTATWIYGAGTDWSRMEARFDLAAAVGGTAHLVVEGMDDELGAKIEIEISVNGTPIFAGADPLPNDDMPLDSGTWATRDFPFDAALLVAGSNQVAIRARTPGTFGRPPFFMLDYADIVIDQP